MSLIGMGNTNGRTLNHEEVRQVISQAAASISPAGKKVLVIIPDHTRTCPLPQVVRELYEFIGKKASKFDLLIALGTHTAMTDEQIDRLLGVEPGRRGEVFPDVNVFNHEWKNPESLRTIGGFTRDEVLDYLPADCEIFARDIDVSVNVRLFDYDKVLICGPVFPHEVVGFSGGAKYFFPGVCGEELLNFFHWLGALITIPKMIGIKDTPVRRMLHAACDMINVEKYALCMVVKGEDLAGIYFDDVKSSWSAAADLSDKLHILYTDRAYDSILSRAPLMYDELWTGGKCMYKMECVVADGGELIIYAPHIHEIAVTHGRIIEEVGYHSLPFFINQWERYKDYPWGVLAHSTHVRGIGKWINGREVPRVTVTLATGIPEETCRRIGMNYRNPASIDISQWQGHESEGKLYVPKAGEMLYRLKNAPEWQQCNRAYSGS
ncbi:MAG TPA: lactate racemase domain-containing protein [Phycisphaerae bacterium]|nr:lactate racemase domain-containing protein [Phycisphaerae bacterium]